MIAAKVLRVAVASIGASVAVCGSAFADYSQTVQLTPGTDYNSTTFSLLAGSYNFAWSLISSDGLSSKSLGSFSVSLLNSNGDDLADGYANIKSLFAGLGGASTGATLPSGTYQLEYQAYGKNYKSITVNASVASVTSVPGPVAGAGVPAVLGFAGFIWGCRRRNAALRH